MGLRKQKNSKIKNIVYKLLSLLLIIASGVFLTVLFYIDLLPKKYSILVLSIVLLFTFINVIFLNLKKLKSKIKSVIGIFSFFAIIIMALGSFYISKTLNVLVNNVDNKYKIENYSVIVLKDSSYNTLNDINGEVVGYFKNSVGSSEAKETLLNSVDISLAGYDSSNSLINDLLEKQINVIILEDSIKNIMDEEMENFSNSIKTIYNFKIKIETEYSVKEVNVTEEPFAVYISGIDTYGEISSVSRSDVNIVMVVNPNIHQILLISIPRDYYVQLHGTDGPKDKLTHAGIYGVDMSIKTIEDLFDVDINYYIKVNFSSVIDIVDALGGLDVYSEYSFISYSDFKFKEGMNYVNGEQALDFARTRKAFIDGDRQRGKNQQAVIEALVRKITSKSVITKYNSLLNAINGKYQTNMGLKKITSLIKMQLNDMASWTVTSYSVTGYDAMDYTYTYNQLLYVMKPDEDSVLEAIRLIDEVLSDEKLESSYGNLDGESNQVSKVYIAPEPVNLASNEEKNDPEKEKKNDPSDLDGDAENSEENNQTENTINDNNDSENSKNNDQNEDNVNTGNNDGNLNNENNDKNEENGSNNPIDSDPLDDLNT